MLSISLKPLAELETARDNEEIIPTLENEDDELPPPETVNIVVEDDLIENPDVSLCQEELPPPETVTIHDDHAEHPDASLCQFLCVLDVDPLSVERESETLSTPFKIGMKPDPEVIKIESSDDEYASGSKPFNRCEPEDDGYRSASDEGTCRQKADSSHLNSSEVQIIANKKIACDQIEQASTEQNSTIKVGVPGEELNSALGTRQGDQALKGEEKTQMHDFAAPKAVVSLESAVINKNPEPVAGTRQSSRASKEWAKIRMHDVISGEFSKYYFTGSRRDRMPKETQNNRASKGLTKMRGTLHKVDTSLFEKQNECVQEQRMVVQMNAGLTGPDVISFHETAKNDCQKESAAIHNLLLSGNIKKTMQVVLTRCPEAERLIQSMILPKECLKNKTDVQNVLQGNEISRNKTSIKEISLSEVANNYEVEKIPNVRLVKSHDTAEWQVTPIQESSNSRLKRCIEPLEETKWTSDLKNDLIESIIPSADIKLNANNDLMCGKPIVRKDTSLREEQSTIGESDKLMIRLFDGSNSSVVQNSQQNNTEKGAGLQPTKCTDYNMLTSVTLLNEQIQECVQNIQKVQDVKYSPFQCKLCGKTLSSSVRLKNHIAIHRSSPRYNCHDCGEKFFFRDHMRKHHAKCAEKTSNECEICKRSFITKKSLNIHRTLKRHVLRHPRIKNSSANADFCTNDGYNVFSSSNLNKNKVELADPLQHSWSGQSPGMSSEHESVLEKQSIEPNESASVSMKNLRKGLRLAINKVNFVNSLPSQKLLNEKSVFNCEVCGKRYPTVLKLNVHRYVHGLLTPQNLKEESLSSLLEGLPKRRKQWPCSICGRVLSSKNNLKVHFNGHLKIKPFQCHICHKIFSSSYNLKLHFNIHTGVKSYKCDLCICEYYTPSGLKRHRLRFHKLKVLHKPRYFCHGCGKSFIHLQQLQEHQCKNSGRSGKEIHCKEQVTSDVSKMIQTSTFNAKSSISFQKRGPFQCHFCDKILLSSRRLEDHVRSRHTFERPYQCDACSKTFASRDALRMHQKKKKNCSQRKPKLELHLKPYKCAMCGIVFNLNSDLKKHIEHVHATQVFKSPELDSQSTNEKPSCNLCLKSFPKPSILRKHIMRVHVNVRMDGAYKCDLCPKTFTKVGYLVRHKNQYHLESQQKVKKFKCDQSLRSSEVKVASSKNRVPCEQCGRVFGNRGSFVQHKCKIHTGNINDSSAEKSSSDVKVAASKNRVPCEQCGRVFGNRGSFVQHKCKIHTGNINDSSAEKSSFKERKYKCNRCDAKFVARFALRRHTRRFHIVKDGSSVHSASSLKDGYKCDFCNVILQHKGNISAHVLMYHKNEYQTFSLNGSFGSDVAFDAASASQEHNTKPRENLKYTSVNRSVKKLYPCNLCNAKYRWKYDLVRHKQKCHAEPNEKPGGNVKPPPANHTVRKFYSCNLCNSKFIFKANLMRHKRTYHKGNEQNYSSISSVNLPSRSKLSNHSEKSAFEPCHSCSLCGESFKGLTDLKDHMLVHTTQLSSFRCDFCFETFSTALGLKHHMYSHVQKNLLGINNLEKSSSTAICVEKTKDRRKVPVSRSYKCEVCKKIFSTMSSLKRHKMTHSGERPHVCEICGSGFKERFKLFLHSMKEHVNVGTNNQTVKQMFKHFSTNKCDTCGKYFARRGNFERHLCLNMVKENSIFS